MVTSNSTMYFLERRRPTTPATHLLSHTSNPPGYANTHTGTQQAGRECNHVVLSINKRISLKVKVRWPLESKHAQPGRWRSRVSS